MPTFTEWVAGETAAGTVLPADKVLFYRNIATATPQPAGPSAWQDCKHRLPVIAERKADLCGRSGEMFPVFGCAIHGECVMTRFCKRQPERLCYLCDDAETREQVPQG